MRHLPKGDMQGTACSICMLWQREAGQAVEVGSSAARSEPERQLHASTACNPPPSEAVSSSSAHRAALQHACGAKERAKDQLLSFKRSPSQIAKPSSSHRPASPPRSSSLNRSLICGQQHLVSQCCFPTTTAASAPPPLLPATELSSPCQRPTSTQRHWLSPRPTGTRSRQHGSTMTRRRRGLLL
jgi:hypothetical protein